MKPEHDPMNTTLSPSAPDVGPAAGHPRAWWQQVREDVRCVLVRDPAARNRLEVWTIYPGVQAVACHRLAHALWRRGWRYAPRWLSSARAGSRTWTSTPAPASVNASSSTTARAW